MICLLFILITITFASFCHNKKSGFYCNTDHSYLWCYGHPHPSQMMCPTGTSCRCGYSSFNPCGFHQQLIEDCDGSFTENENSSDKIESDDKHPSSNNSDIPSSESIDSEEIIQSSSSELNESEDFYEPNYCD